jgi:hypothetical protein
MCVCTSACVRVCQAVAFDSRYGDIRYVKEARFSLPHSLTHSLPPSLPPSLPLSLTFSSLFLAPSSISFSHTSFSRSLARSLSLIYLSSCCLNDTHAHAQAVAAAPPRRLRPAALCPARPGLSRPRPTRPAPLYLASIPFIPHPYCSLSKIMPIRLRRRRRNRRRRAQTSCASMVRGRRGLGLNFKFAARRPPGRGSEDESEPTRIRPAMLDSDNWPGRGLSDFQGTPRRGVTGLLVQVGMSPPSPTRSRRGRRSVVGYDGELASEWLPV